MREFAKSIQKEIELHKDTHSGTRPLGIHWRNLLLPPQVSQYVNGVGRIKISDVSKTTAERLWILADRIIASEFANDLMHQSS